MKGLFLRTENFEKLWNIENTEKINFSGVNYSIGDSVVVEEILIEEGKHKRSDRYFVFEVLEVEGEKTTIKIVDKGFFSDDLIEFASWLLSVVNKGSES